jgi:3-oxoacyl-[acyl-carrier protein] reductase
VDLGVRDRGYLIVGGTAGMGYATAEVLVADGARVAIVGRDRDRGEKAAATLHAESSATVVYLAGDASLGQAEADRLVAEARTALGELAGVAVTAGGAPRAMATLEEATDEIWMESFEGLLMATVRIVKAAVPVLIEEGGGTVVTTAAYSVHSPHHNRMPYVTFKSGVVTFTKNVAKTYGPRGLRANCVAPGAIETGGLAALRSRIAREQGIPEDGILERMMKDEWHMDVALGRPGRPHEVGELMAVLLSPRAGYLTGALVNIDGGTDF